MNYYCNNNSVKQRKMITKSNLAQQNSFKRLWKDALWGAGIRAPSRSSQTNIFYCTCNCHQTSKCYQK